MYKFIFIVIAIFTLSGCKAQSDESLIKNTSSKILEAIKEKNVKKIKDLIGVELDVIGKDDEDLQFDLDKMESYYKRYVKGSTPQITLTDEYDELGRRKVIVLFYKGSDIENNTSEVVLELFFGPPNFVILTKNSDYTLVIKRIKEITPTVPSTPQPLPKKNLNY